jgi:AcrR family transcriptional regulator
MTVLDRRAALLAATWRVIARSGVQAASTRAITAEAGMALASFHYAFESRDALFRALIEDAISVESDAATEGLDLAAGDADAGTLIRLALDGYLTSLQTDPGREQGMVELTQHALRVPELVDLPRRQYQRYRELAVEVLTRIADASGRTWDRPATELATLVDALTDGITLARLSGADDHAAGDLLAELAVESLAAHLVPQS